MPLRVWSTQADALSNLVEPCSRSPKLATVLMLSRKRWMLSPATRVAAAPVALMAGASTEGPPASSTAAGMSAGEVASAGSGVEPGFGFRSGPGFGPGLASFSVVAPGDPADPSDPLGGDVDRPPSED